MYTLDLPWAYYCCPACCPSQCSRIFVPGGPYRFQPRMLFVVVLLPFFLLRRPY